MPGVFGVDPNPVQQCLQEETKMKLNGMKAVSDKEVQGIRDASIRILEETEVKIDSEKASTFL